MKDLTPRQREILDFLTNFIEAKSYPPTVRETAKAFSISIKGAYDHMKALEKKGVIRFQENRSRTLEIIKREVEDKSFVELPILGTIAAGTPVFADENLEGTIRVAAEHLKSGQHFALRIRGDSMRDAGINSGDIAIIEQRQTAENGDIIVALIEDSATLKRFYKENNRIRLQAENPDYAPIFTKDLKILGRLKAIFRSY